ncbi:MAG: hypothetical protein H8F28_13010 [Fibrella sp.]|nr:hypothetical protein [Armatimonadota bacterium]
MNTITFYRWSLLTPIAVPVALLPFVRSGNPLADIAQFFIWSLIIGGIPYLLTLSLFARTLICGTERQYTVLTLIAPLAMVAVQTGCGFVYGFATSAGNRIAAFESAGFGLMLGACTLLLGYGYVALTHLGLWLFRRLGLVC